MDISQIIAKYGSVEQARQRIGSLSVVARPLSTEEEEELAALSAVVESTSPLLSPLDWWRQKSGKWERACLAASLRGWDPLCEDPSKISEAEYDAALAAADAHFASVAKEHVGPASKVADSSAGKRAFILSHPEHMAAVIAYRPQPVEAIHMINTVRGANDEGSIMSTDQRSAFAMAELWNRVLWPTGQQAQAIMDNDPGGYAVGYPMAYWRAIGLNARDVRGK